MLGRFNEDLATLTRAIRRGDGETLFKQFAHTRDPPAIVEIGQDSATPDFGRPHPELPQLCHCRPYAARRMITSAQLDMSAAPTRPALRHTGKRLIGAQYGGTR